MDLACPMCKKPLGSGGNRVTTAAPSGAAAHLYARRELWDSLDPGLPLRLWPDRDLGNEDPAVSARGNQRRAGRRRWEGGAAFQARHDGSGAPFAPRLRTLSASSGKGYRVAWQAPGYSN